MHRRHTVICPPDRLSGHGLHKHTNLATWALNTFFVKTKTSSNNAFHPVGFDSIISVFVNPKLYLLNRNY